MTRVSTDLMDLDRRRPDTDACRYDSGFSAKHRSPHHLPDPLKTSLPFALSPPSPSKRHPPQNPLTSLEDAVASDAELDGIYRSQGMEENERRARIAIRHAFRTNQRLKESYMPLSVLGYGSNGVVLLAHVMGDPARRVALKIIYRSRQFPPTDVPSTTTQPAIPNEIHLLRLLARDAPHPNVLLHLDDFSDARHHYLITELHADPAHLIPPTTTSTLHFHYDLDPSPTFQPLKHILPLAPHTPTAAPATIRVHVHLPLAAGASDLWAWSNNHLHSPSSAFTSPAYTHPSFTIPLRPPPLPTTRAVFAQMAGALHHLHAYNVYHGDVKEENLLISPISSKPDVVPSVKLCDFGHAGASGGDGVPRIRAYGTREMASPELIAFQYRMRDAGGAEQLAEEGVSAFPCDVWALGLVLFALLHGPGCLPEVVRKKAWEESVVMAASDGSFDVGGPVAFLPLGRVRPDLGRDCLDLIRGMTVMDPARRLTMDEVMAHPWVNGF
ncbi:Chk1 protein kinase [Irineochytrium annulatum]|nr:Chk1 protein kinase [Irineochytrium annulatum]